MSCRDVNSSLRAEGAALLRSARSCSNSTTRELKQLQRGLIPHFFLGEILSVTRQKVTMERTFAIIKPDAMRNGKAEDILRDIQNAGALHTR